MKNKNEHHSVGEMAREKLVQAALDLFGRQGLDGVSIRQISDLAEMNVASISYHFGSKDGLYEAVADHLSEQISLHNKTQTEAAAHFIDSRSQDTEKAIEHIISMVDNIIDVMIPDSEKSERWARFISRFQLGEHIPDHPLSNNPLHMLMPNLIGIARKRPDEKLENAILAQTIFGQILVFRVNRLTSKKVLGVSNYGSEEVLKIKKIVFSNIQKLLS